jgi:hypothetical protein
MFQTQVNAQQAPAVAGDFASANPRASVVAPEGGFVAGAGGVTVGKFAWIADDGRTVQSFGNAPNAPDGFVHRDQQALITAFLGEASNVIPARLCRLLCNAAAIFSPRLQDPPRQPRALPSMRTTATAISPLVPELPAPALRRPSVRPIPAAWARPVLPRVRAQAQ